MSTRAAFWIALATVLGVIVLMAGLVPAAASHRHVCRDSDHRHHYMPVQPRVLLPPRQPVDYPATRVVPLSEVFGERWWMW